MNMATASVVTPDLECHARRSMLVEYDETRSELPTACRNMKYRSDVIADHLGILPAFQSNSLFSNIWRSLFY
jgi:hypothetical protein